MPKSTLNNTCEKCFRPFIDLGQSSAPVKTCECKKNILIGWECPVCHSGVSPYTKICPCNLRITKTSSSTDYYWGTIDMITTKKPF